MNKIILFFTLLTLMYIQASAQCMMTPFLLNQRVSNSSLVIEGKVINQTSFWNPNHSNIFTSNLIEVYKTFKSNSSAYIEIITEGGTVGNDKEVVKPSLELSIGDVGVFTLNSNTLPSQFGKPVYEAFASAQGFIKYNVSENEANEPFKKYLNITTNLYLEIQQSTLSNYNVVKSINPFALPTVNSTQAVAAITGFSPTTITAGTFSVLTINGSAFGATQGTSFVEFKNADDGGATYIRPHASQYVLWSATQIQVMVPTTSSVSATAGSGTIRVDVGGVKTTSTASLTVQYAHINVFSNGSLPNTVYNTRHVNKQAGGYVWQMYTTFDSNAPAKASFLRAFQSWRCGTYINWTTGTTTTVNVAANDGTNVIRFDVGTELPAGVLGCCTNYFSGCGTQPNQTWFVTELDIVFDSGTSWNYGPATSATLMDFESVAVHELGHGHELGHVIKTTEIMNFSIGAGQTKRTLSTNDLAGGNAVMARNLSGGVCAIPAMTSLTASNCVIGAPTANFIANRTTVCPGQTVVFTNLSTGSPTLNTWTFAGGTPSTSTVSSPTVTYNTPGSYSVQLVVSNSFGNSTYTVPAYINVTSAATLPLVQDFQSATYPPTNWYINDAGNDNIKWKLKTTAGYNSTQSTVFDNWTDSITPNRDELKTYVNLSGFSAAKMTFYRSYSQTFSTPLIDTLQIGVSTNCGTSTTYPYLKGGSQLATATSSSSAAPFTPTATAQWKKDSIDLTPYVGQANVMIAFINRGHYGDAIYLDNINIIGVAAATPTAAINSPSVSCTGTPIILTDASTGGPSSWLWNTAGGTPATANTQSVSVTYTTAGVKTITLTVANASGTTTATKSITITATPTVIASITNTTICSGTAVVATVTGATTYTWLPSGSGFTSTLTPTSTTIYTVTGRNGSCVSAPKTFTVNVTTTPTVIATATNVSCFGLCNGSITIGVTGGSAPFTYSWSQGGQTTQSVTNLCTGSYSCIVTDLNGCKAAASGIVTQPPVLILSVNSNNVKCFGTSTGTIAAAGSGGTPPYSYNLNGGAYQASSTFSNQVAGVYSMSILDANGCIATKTVQLTQPPIITLTSTTTPANCGLPNGSATVTATGGVPAYTYTWSAGSNSASQGSLLAGTYTITVKDANNCIKTLAATISGIAGPTISITSQTNVSCFGGTNGAATTNVTGGVSPYIYSWSNGTTNSSATNLAAGLYSVSATDQAGCITTTFVTISQTTALIVTPTSTTICAGQTTTLTASGATNYSWLPGAQTTTVVIVTPTITTVYTVTGTSTGGCVTTKTTVVSVNPKPTAILSFTNPTCGLNNGIIAIIPTNTVSISTITSTSGTVTGQTITGLGAGSSTITLTSNLGCTFTVSATLTTTPGPSSITIVSTNATCGLNNGSFTFGSPIGGTSPYTYAINGGAFSATSPVTGLASGAYSVTVKDANGCMLSQTTAIGNITGPTSATVVAANASCGNVDGTATVTAVTGGVPSYSFSFDGGAFTGTSSITGLAVGNHSVVIRDANTCALSIAFYVFSLGNPTVNISASSTTICAGQSATLTASGATNYNWLPSAQTTTIIAVTPSITTTYTLNGANGTCTSSKTITINVSSSPTIATSITNTTICFGNSTQLSASASGGSGVYSYTWTPNLGIGGGPYTINPGSTASYTVAATDGNGCLASPKIITINVTPPLSASGFVVSKCNGDVTMLTPNITSPGNNGPYNFLWSTGQSDVGVFTSSSSVTANFLSAPNTYTVYIDDGCTIPSATAVFTVNVNPQIAATISNTNASCSSCADGAAIVLASGGTPGYIYIWMPGTITTPFANNLAVGCYTATITDANGCSTSTTTCVSFGTKVDEAQVSNSISIYPNPSNGVFTISATSDNLEITIINTLGQTVKTETMKNSNQMTIDMSKMSKGIYYLQAKISDSTKVFKLILE